MAPCHSKLGKTITKMTSKQLMEKYFMLNEQQSTSTKQKFVCKLCHPEWSEAESVDAATIKTVSKGSGYQWALQHLQCKHEGQFESETASSQTMLISSNAKNTFEWIQWVVSEI